MAQCEVVVSDSHDDCVARQNHFCASTDCVWDVEQVDHHCTWREGRALTCGSVASGGSHLQGRLITSMARLGKHRLEVPVVEFGYARVYIHHPRSGLTRKRKG